MKKSDSKFHSPEIVESKSNSPARSALEARLDKKNASQKVPLVVPKRSFQDDFEDEDYDDDEYPHCSLPNHYFDAMLARMKSEVYRSRNLLSIETWEGRKVVSLETADD
ncbi:MAG: hypothetical protein KDD70_07360 [Bdellovibrionales bacterium]|nr:hypothetical protein [Bdellovibrionales bacterium]